MAFKLSDPFGTKRRGKKKRAASETAAGKVEAAGAQFQSDIGKVQEQITQQTTQLSDTLRADTERAAGVFDPFVSAGVEAQETLSGALGLGGRGFDPSILTSSPQFQFAQEQGLQAGERSLAASGLSKSGRAAKELARFSSGLASNTFDSFLNRLSGVIESGRGAAFGQSQALQQGIGIQAQLGTGLAESQGRLGVLGAQVGLQTAQSATDLRLGGKLGEIEAAGANVSQLINLGTQAAAAVGTGGFSSAFNSIKNRFGGGGSPQLTPNQEANQLPIIF